MALPTLTSSYRARINPASMITRRNREHDNHERACINAGFFQWNDMVTNKKREWESKTSFNNSMNACMSGAVRNAHAVNLENRRLKLSQMLADERDEFEAELKQLKLGRQPTLRDLAEQCESLRSARELRRKQLAEQKLYEHWRVNSPDMRQVESERKQKHVVESWSRQVEEQRQREAAARLAEAEEARRIEEERAMAEELEREREAERVAEACRLRDSLQAQMSELRQREAEANLLKEDEALLIREKTELVQLEEERRRKEAEFRRTEHGRVLLRQHAAALRRRSHLIQQQLEEDKKFLEALSAQEQRESHIESARRQQAAADVMWMKKVIEDQLHTEKIREAELDLLYQEEAARMWQQRENEWEREKRAREQLMSEVLRGRQAQIEGKMEEVRRQQEEGIERRRELLEQLKKASEERKREEEQHEETSAVHRQQLQQQISSQYERRQSERVEENIEAENDVMEEQEYEDRLREETSRMRIAEYQPKSYGRRQAWT